jgi:pentatricopeptide repeat protein
LGIKADSWAYDALLDACMKANEWGTAETVYREMRALGMGAGDDLSDYWDTKPK